MIHLYAVIGISEPTITRWLRTPLSESRETAMREAIEQLTQEMEECRMEKFSYSVGELAQLLGVGRSVAYALANQSDFPAVRTGQRRIIVPADRLRVWLDAQAEQSLAAGR
jgi:excisionase family DNA binding protein